MAGVVRPTTVTRNIGTWSVATVVVCRVGLGTGVCAYAVPVARMPHASTTAVRIHMMNLGFPRGARLVDVEQLRGGGARSAPRQTSENLARTSAWASLQRIDSRAEVGKNYQQLERAHHHG